jgi:hypothetical protein
MWACLYLSVIDFCSIMGKAFGPEKTRYSQNRNV